MKKILIVILLAAFCLSNIAASDYRDSPRKIAEEISPSHLTDDDEVIKDSQGVVFGVDMIAIDSNAWLAVYDGTSDDDVSDANLLGEVAAATSGNSDHKDWGLYGIKAYKGIYVEGNYCTAVIQYY